MSIYLEETKYWLILEVLILKCRIHTQNFYLTVLLQLMLKVQVLLFKHLACLCIPANIERFEFQ
jgi:hypothetical protein